MIAVSEVELIAERAEKLSDDDMQALIEKLKAKLRQKLEPENAAHSQTNEKRVGIYFGAFADYPGEPVDEEDFKAAEYHFKEEEWR